jgi:predicted SprT family Zn-dependent metalloprotease
MHAPLRKHHRRAMIQENIINISFIRYAGWIVSHVESPSQSSDIPEQPVQYDPRKILPQWAHPLLAARKPAAPRPDVKKAELEAFAYDYYLRFLPFFRGKPEGSLNPGVLIEFTRKMRYKLGLAYLFEHKIKLNQDYFTSEPALLPYTLFHEMTHIWLYDCMLDPGHTRRFYAKMTEFRQTGLPIDPDVHIHTRVATEAKFIYMCPSCSNRWYLRDKLRHRIYCGFCHEREQAEYFAKLVKPNSRPYSNRQLRF